MKPLREQIEMIIYDNVDDGGIGTQDATDKIMNLFNNRVEQAKKEILEEIQHAKNCGCDEAVEALTRAHNILFKWVGV